MKFNINDPLFKIETNKGFNVKKINKSKVFDEALSYFNINKKYSLYLVNKQLKNTSIYFVKSKKNIFVLRSSSSQDSKHLEKQCKVVSKLKKKYFLKLLKGKNGYIFKTKNLYLILYKKVEGNVFNGKINKLNKIFYNIIQLHKDFKNKNISNFDLPIKKYEIKEIKENIKLLTNKRFINKILSKNIIGKKTKKIITENSFYIKKCINNIIHPQVIKKNLQVVHGDLNHSNIIISKNYIKFVDLEDLIVDNLKIAMSFGIFKILRHAVFININKINYINTYAKKLCDDLIKKNFFSSHKEIFDMCVLRILSDISLIINSFYDGEKKYLYDFEKKFLNLIELRYIFKLHELKS